MDPQLLLMLLPLLMQGGGAGGGASGGGVGSMLGGGIGSISSLLSGLMQPSGSGSVSGGLTGALGGGISGAELGSIFPGIGTLIGGGLGALMGGLGGGGMLSIEGVPRTQKTSGIESALAGSPSMGNQALADYIQNQVLGKGDVLSSSGGANSGKMAQMIEWLTGSSLPNIGGGNKGGNYTENLGSAGGISVPRDISRLQALLGQSPDLSPATLQAFLPQIESMVGNFGGGKNSGGLPGLAGNIMARIGSLSAQQSAGAPLGAASGGGAGGGKSGGAGGVNNPTGTGGNPLAALFGGGGTGSPMNMNAIMAKLKQMTGGGLGGGGGLVGATA